MQDCAIFLEDLRLQAHLLKCLLMKYFLLQSNLLTSFSVYFLEHLFFHSFLPVAQQGYD